MHTATTQEHVIAHVGHVLVFTEPVVVPVVAQPELIHHPVHAQDTVWTVEAAYEESGYIERSN